MADIDLLNLNTGRGFKILGSASNDGAGISVSSAGDVNGDGVADVIVGAYYADPSGRTNAGTAYVIYGKSGGLSDLDLLNLTSAQGFKILGSASYDKAGYSVSSAGDVNGDGVADVIVGAYGAGLSGRRAGTSYVIYGKSGGLTDLDLLNFTTAQGFKILGSVNGDAAGYSVNSAGDVNGDGVVDVIVGAYQADPSGRTDAGTAYVIYCNTGNLADVDLLNLTSAQGFKILGSAGGSVPYGDNAGISVSSAGDINGDGINDVLVGAPGTSTSGSFWEGTAYIIYGKLGGPADVDLLNLTIAQGFKSFGRSGDSAGRSVSSAGDINGDGINDVLVGAPGTSPSGRTNAGTAYVVYGKTGGLADVNLRNLTTAQGFKILGAAGGTIYDSAGRSVSSAGDINGDGINDVLVGATGASPSGRTNAGTAYVIYGKTGGPANVDLLNLTAAQGFKILGAASSDSAGNSVSSAGDINGDGVNDIIVGAYGASPGGRAQAGTAYVIYSGKSVVGTIGNDVIVPTLAIEDIDGLAGIDTVNYVNSTAGVIVSLMLGVFGVGGNADGDSIVNCEIIIGSNFNDTLTGDLNTNTIQGGPGADTLDGGAGTDTVSYVNSAAGVTVSLMLGSGTGGDAAGDTVSNFENILGSGLDDTLTGDANVNDIQGNGGNDIIEGKAGSDTLDGGTGQDTLSYASSTVAVTVILATNSVSGGDATGDTIFNFENIIGSGFADTLTGDTGDNNIQGGAGDDIIKDGDGGNDLLTGGTGNDDFVISTSPGTVTITDFNGSEDLLDVSRHNVGLAQIMSAAVNNGNNCEITLGSKKIILLNTKKEDIQSTWFTSLVGGGNTTVIQASPAKWPTQKDVISMVSSFVSAAITLGGLAIKSKLYYKQGVLGHNRFYSFMTSKVPYFITRTTAAVIAKAEAAVESVFRLKGAFDTIKAGGLQAELQKAITIAIVRCNDALKAADAARTAAAAALASGARSAQAALEVANVAFDKYTKTLEQFTKLQNELSGTEMSEVVSKTPIGIALGSDQIELVSLEKSQVSFDYIDNGIKAKTAWVGAKDAFLIYDHNDSGSVDVAKELVLTQWSKIATTDFMALKEVFDSNRDNKFDAHDAEFNRFQIWQDKNQDGITQAGELTGLSEAGLVQIDFDTERTIAGEFFGRQQDMMVAGVLWQDGHQTLAYDLALDVASSS
jgi:hypothetical protein